MSQRMAAAIRGNVFGLIAIFIALSGTAVALDGKNTVQSNDIGPGEQVRNSDTKPVQGTWVADNSLTGADVLESSLGTVPSATTAGTATTAGSAPPSGSANGDLTGSYPGPDIAGNAVGGPEVGPDALGGADFDESTLGIVPNANQLDSLDSTDFTGADEVHNIGRVAVNDSTPGDNQATVEPLLTVGDFQFQGDCGENLTIIGGQDVASLGVTGPAGTSWAGVRTDTFSDSLVSTATPDAPSTGVTRQTTDTNEIGFAHVIALTPTGDAISFTLSAEVNAGDADCIFTLAAISGP